MCGTYCGISLTTGERVKEGGAENGFHSLFFLNADFFLFVLRFNLLQIVALSMTLLRQTVILK